MLSKGIDIGSVSVSFKILDISDIIQLFTAFGLLHTLTAPSNKSDKYFEEVKSFASWYFYEWHWVFSLLFRCQRFGRVYTVFVTFERINFGYGYGKVYETGT